VLWLPVATNGRKCNTLPYQVQPTNQAALENNNNNNNNNNNVACVKRGKHMQPEAGKHATKDNIRHIKTCQTNKQTCSMCQTRDKHAACANRGKVCASEITIGCVKENKNSTITLIG